MAEPSSPPPSNAGLRILLTKDRPRSSSPSTFAPVSSHADRDRIIGVFREALSRTDSPEAFALQAVQEAIKPQKQPVLVLEENQSLENALRRLLQELVVALEAHSRSSVVTTFGPPMLLTEEEQGRDEVTRDV